MTKLAAWRGRGHGDTLRSLDLHDILVLIDGRPELPPEIAQEPSAVRDYIAAELDAITVDEYFGYLAESAMQLYGALASGRAARVAALAARLANMVV